MKAVLDCETGGFSITKNGVCSISMLIVNNSLEVVSEHDWLIKPYSRPDSDELVSYKEDAMSVNGMSVNGMSVNGMSVNGILVSDLHEKGIEIKTVCLELWELINSNQIDTYIGHNFKDFARFGIKHENKHSSLGDCYATLELYKKLL